jgi:hypothetical protein
MIDLHNGNLLSAEDAILYVLIRHWDPLRLQNDAVRRGAYERYIPHVRELLAAGTSKESLAQFLCSAGVADFGVVSFPGTRDIKAARKLLEISIHRDKNAP